MSTLVQESPATRESVERMSPATERIAWEYIVVQAAVMWLVSRLALVSFTFFSIILTHHSGTSREAMLAAWYRWDAINYVNIGLHGYATSRDAAFFPLFPVLINLGAHVFGHPVFLATLISNLGTLVAFIGLALLSVREGGDEHTARFSLFALFCWPLGFFLAAAYTEGIFLACAVWCLWAMRHGYESRGYWYLAAACALLAALCRSTGVILFLPMLYEFARQHGWIAWLRQQRIPARLLAWAGRTPNTESPGDSVQTRMPFRLAKEDIAPLAAIIVAIPLGLAIFSIYCLRRYGDFLKWIHIQRDWGRISLPIWETVWKAIAHHRSMPPLSYWQGHTLIDSLPFLVIIVVTILALRRLPFAYTLYLLGLIYLVLASPRIASNNLVYVGSAGRFMLAAIPAYLVIGRWASRFPGVATFFFYGGAMLQAAFLAFFLNGGWIV